ncbi:aminoglycoside phosphotransferase family protein [Exiguobacterium acetylicum]|uniref:aminoglycoside phosphotransferase family protein n=1 Tax=Exiguobacterium acetylicum TaxID=41170 RepID=UPI0011ECB7AB|nr:aminoglycoside phosphotransferase family protein [Exiguobacterium acetylicum]
MTEATRVRIEQLTGDIEYIEQLGEQGGTSTVYRVETKTGKYLLKTATKARYQEWLAEEAIVLEEWMQREPGFLPEYVGFLKTEQQSHLLMQWRDGITLTTALRQATSERRIQLWQAFGTYLFHFHQRATGGTSQEWLTERIVTAERYVTSVWTSGTMDLLKQLKSSCPEPITASWIHGDCTTDNLLVATDGKLSFIDVGAMRPGDRRYDIALAISPIINDPRALDAFYEGYRFERLTTREFDYYEHGLYYFF